MGLVGSEGIIASIIASKEADQGSFSEFKNSMKKYASSLCVPCDETLSLPPAAHLNQLLCHFAQSVRQVAQPLYPRGASCVAIHEHLDG